MFELCHNERISAGGFNFLQRVFGHPLKEVEADGGVVIETDYFHAHQDVAYPIKGLIILASKRHITCLDVLNDEEKMDYINLLSKIRVHHQNVWLISVPTGRFAADASLSRRAELPGGIR